MLVFYQGLVNVPPYMGVPVVGAAHTFQGFVVVFAVVGRFQDGVAQADRDFCATGQVLAESVFGG